MVQCLQLCESKPYTQIDLSTHDAAGITLKDVLLAQACDELYTLVSAQEGQGLFDTHWVEWFFL